MLAPFYPKLPFKVNKDNYIGECCYKHIDIVTKRPIFCLKCNWSGFSIHYCNTDQYVEVIRENIVVPIDCFITPDNKHIENKIQIVLPDYAENNSTMTGYSGIAHGRSFTRKINYLEALRREKE